MYQYISYIIYNDIINYSYSPCQFFLFTMFQFYSFHDMDSCQEEQVLNPKSGWARVWTANNQTIPRYFGIVGLEQMGLKHKLYHIDIKIYQA